MEKFGFFNAKLDGGMYDRKYNANDYSENLAVIISNGVLRSTNDDLKVTADGMTCTVGKGRAWINGHYYLNDEPLTLAPAVAPTGGSRIDRVVLRLDTSINAREIRVRYITGVAANEPVPPAPTRDGDIYELVLADVLVQANGTSVGVVDKRGDNAVCGWIYSTKGNESYFTSLDNTFYEWFAGIKNDLASVTLFKRYTWNTTLTEGRNTVAFNIPQYDEETCFIEVYVNGILETKGNYYAISGNIITFNGFLTAGTEITVLCYKSIDGTGIMTVADEITELQNQMARVQGTGKYTYLCTGLDDNISLSQIAEAIYNGTYTPADLTTSANAFLSALGGIAGVAEINNIKIDVVGKFGATTPFMGTGTSASPYIWLLLGGKTNSDKRVQFNFDRSTKISVTVRDFTTVLSGNNLRINGLVLEATSNNAVSGAITLATDVYTASPSGARLVLENCNITVSGVNDVRISKHGTFINCVGKVMSSTKSAYCFKPSNNTLIRTIGGEYYAYTNSSTGIGSAIFHTSASEVDAVALVHNIHCPTLEIAGYMQTYLSIANAGTTYIDGVVTRLPSSGDYNQINGHINRSKL